VSATSTTSIPVTRDAVEVARRAATEFTGRGVPVPALLELIASSAPGHQITATELPAHDAENETAQGLATALLAHR